MNRRKTLVTIMAIGLILGSYQSFAQTAEDLISKGIQLEEVKGELEKAIEVYQTIVTRFSDNRPIAAKAQLHIGLCYEKLGRIEAEKAYQLVIERYPNQTEQVAEARARMAELKAPKKEEQSLSHIYSRADDDFLLESMSLSPDGTKLLGIHISMPTGQNVVYKNLTTGKFEFITNFDWESEGHGYTYNPVWSPDGAQVAFTFDGWKDPLQELWISDLRGESRSIYQCEAEDDRIFPVEWFPGGQKILAIHIIQKKLIRLGTLPIQEGTFSSLYEIVPQKGVKLDPNVNNLIKADLSPDGKHVVFHELKEGIKNIYVLDIAGKTVKPLMDSIANNMWPCWAPDGKFVAFMSDRSGTKTIWAISMNADGSAKGKPFVLRLSQNSKLVNWTAQGLCYTTWTGMVDVFIMPVDPQTGAPTGKPRQLEFRPTGSNFYPIWSPDGKQLAFMSDLYGVSGELYVVIYPMSGGEVRKFRVPSPRERMNLRFLDLRWLPDGSGISYSAKSAQKTAGSEEDVDFKMYVLNLDSGEWQSLDLKLEFKFSFTDWRGDGKGIYYTRTIPKRKREKSDILDPGIVERDLTTGDERYIYRRNGATGGFSGIRCSRDSSKLAFYQMRDWKLFVIDTKSGEILNEFKDPGFPSPPTWSPDGKNLMIWLHNKLFVLSIGDGSRKAYDVNMDFVPSTRIRVLDWSPDGTKVAFDNLYTMSGTYIMRNVIPEGKQ